MVILGDVISSKSYIVRFYKEETANDAAFAEKLASNADLYVNDAFGTAHRAHASTEGVTKYLSPSVAGFLLQKELDYLEVHNPSTITTKEDRAPLRSQKGRLLRLSEGAKSPARLVSSNHF